ncbi:NUDIX domain-containing protein [Pseudogulbenkiania subflava]|uniref:GDP-mannose pyrophosphatase n=1 Tax=Pseudogulbenkiania subflava DSM 22618 TaxID=1123014 RepID=A0A1Y6BEJ5_9NEIS|nr:NUDIX hydrolase [Pseudogulbenkiania subflava]SMF07294.1 ADP-ribose pyrophosphatase [Pseudogulbenkiania subflava DSM 22618]
MELVEQTLSTETVYQGGFLQVRRDKVQLPDGSTAFREYILHPGAVAILALTPDGELVMERQYRYPAGRVFLEIPAGKIDPDEARDSTARRELREETGYQAERWTYLGTAHPCIGYANEQISYYLAQDLTLHERQLDHGEFLDVVTVPLADAMGMALTGEICDSKSIVGLHWLSAHLDGRLPGATV